MTRTSPFSLIAFAIFGGAAGWLLETAIVSSGSPMLVPPVTLAVALAIIGIVDIALAVPVRRAVRARESARIDPFYATRVVVLAKASALAGALLAGVAIGVLVYLLSRPILPGVGSNVMAVAAVVGSVVLLVGGLVAEYMCSIPPDDEDRDGHDNPATIRPH